MAKKLHFESKEAFRKYNAYRFIHGEEKEHIKGDYPEVYLHGKKHKVKH